MNIGEANDLNRFLRWFFDRPPEMGTQPTEEQAKQALMNLAGKANKALMAGMDEKDVERLWDAARRPSSR